MTADSDGRRLYVSHDREVVVLDLDTSAMIGKIPGKSIQWNRERQESRPRLHQPGSAIIVDLKTLATIEAVPAGADPNVVLFDRKTQRVFTARPRHRAWSLPLTRRPARMWALSKVLAEKPSMLYLGRKYNKSLIEGDRRDASPRLVHSPEIATCCSGLIFFVACGD